MYFDEGSDRLRLPERLREALVHREGQPMVLGVRPESLSYSNEGKFAGQENTLNATISVVEPLGDKMDLHVETPTHEHIVCRVEADRSLRDGMQLPMYLAMDQVHVFEPGEEGVNVSLNGAGDQVSAGQSV